MAGTPPIGSSDTSAEPDAMQTLADGVLHRDRGAIARALNLLEDRRPTMRSAQRALVRHLAASAAADPGLPARAYVVGVTGPPGAGKSTLCAALARSFRDAGFAVGVVAVDPSSAKSGGALLGDRVRIVNDTPDPGVFVRSLATGGDLGGLARTAPACAELLAAATDIVLVETVGVGQSEIDVAAVADVTLVVVQPASGDALQFLKAGLFEIPDVIVVGKSDLGDAATRAEAELRHALAIGEQVGVHGTARDAHWPRVVRASGATGEGVTALTAAIRRAIEVLGASGELARRRSAGAARRALTMIERRVGEVGVEALGGADVVQRRIHEEIEAGSGAIECAEWVIEAAIRALRAPR